MQLKQERLSRFFKVSGHGGRREGAGRKPGVTNKVTGEIRETAREYGLASIQRLALMAGLLPDQPGADSQAVQVVALKELLDRGYGRATSVLAGDAGNPIGFVIRGPVAVSSTEEWLRLHAPPDAGPHVVIDAEAEPAAPEPSAPTPAASVPAPAKSSAVTAAEWLAEFNRSGRD